LGSDLLEGSLVNVCAPVGPRALVEEALEAVGYVVFFQLRLEVFEVLCPCFDVG